MDIIAHRTKKMTTGKKRDDESQDPSHVLYVLATTFPDFCLHSNQIVLVTYVLKYLKYNIVLTDVCEYL